MSENINYSEHHNATKRTWNKLHPDYLIDPNEDVVVSMFHVPIAHVKVKDWPHKKAKLLKLYENTLPNSHRDGEDIFDVTTDFHYNEYGNDGSSAETSYSETVNTLLDDELATLENLLLPPDRCIDNFTEALGLEHGVYFKITNSWFEKSAKYGQHTPHTHGSRGYSCVLFVNYDKEEHKPTVYMNPFTSYFYGCNVDWTCPEAGEGSLLCWPAPIIHYTYPNASDRDRLVLSWNMSVVDESGVVLE